jgi:hypothetical protein
VHDEKMQPVIRARLRDIKPPFNHKMYSSRIVLTGLEEKMAVCARITRLQPKFKNQKSIAVDVLF